jgi:hypothetical protein
MRIYVAGPMRGYPEFNHPEFHAATRTLRELGHEVFSPAEHDNANGYDFTGKAGAPEDMHEAGFDLRAALGDDLTWICREADAIVVLVGWEKSLGAAAEVATAHALDLPVWTIADFAESGDQAPQVTGAAA